MDTIRFVDTTIRDGHQSLWAENMTTGMMLPIAEKLDNAGFEGIELISGSHLKGGQNGTQTFSFLFLDRLLRAGITVGC